MIETLRLPLDDPDGCRVRGLEEVAAVRGLLHRIEARWLSSLHKVVLSGEAEAAARMAVTDCLAEYTRRTRNEVLMRWRRCHGFGWRISSRSRCMGNVLMGRCMLMLLIWPS